MPAFNCMVRTLVAALAAALASGLTIVATYGAFLLLVPLVPHGVLLGVSILALSVICILACAGIGSAAHAWVERPADDERS